MPDLYRFCEGEKIAVSVATLPVFVGLRLCGPGIPSELLGSLFCVSLCVVPVGAGYGVKEKTVFLLDEVVDDVLFSLSILVFYLYDVPAVFLLCRFD